jgi:uncharacterized protein YbjT (DUF2867 family)
MILITGATGKNGMAIIKGLAASGQSTRAMVRKEPEQKYTFPDGPTMRLQTLTMQTACVGR